MKLPFISKPDSKMKHKKDYMDYARGVVDLKEAIEGKKKPVISADFSLHVNEAALAIHYAQRNNGFYKMQTKLKTSEISLQKTFLCICKTMPLEHKTQQYLQVDKPGLNFQIKIEVLVFLRLLLQ